MQQDQSLNQALALSTVKKGIALTCFWQPLNLPQAFWAIRPPLFRMQSIRRRIFSATLLLWPA